VLLIGMVTKSGDVAQTPDDLMVGGGITLGAGAALLGAGLLMRYFGTTFVEVEPLAATPTARRESSRPRLVPGGFAW
jgi:hypothetical protein